MTKLLNNVRRTPASRSGHKLRISLYQFVVPVFDDFADCVAGALQGAFVEAVEPAQQLGYVSFGVGVKVRIR